MSKPKKPKVVRTPRRYETCPEDVAEFCHRVRSDSRPDLDHITITWDFAFAPTKDGEPCGYALLHHGYPVGAIVRIVPVKDRVSGLSDVIVRISYEWWESHPSDADRTGLIRHELRHLIPSDKFDTAGRPKLSMRPHDFELGGFYDGIGQDQEHAPELQSLAEVNKQLREKKLLQQSQFWG